ncbi:MAG: SpoIIE family protein phosphatase [Bacteroidia bacterium]|jgi:serine phosphatase RsbU (regulator of sigma subunit)
MSLLNITKLNETVREKKVTRPDLVFNQVREDIIKALNPEGTQEEGRDGMDASFCSFDFNNLKLEYACANNPIWVLRNDTLIESKFDKMPVGMYGGPKTDFTLHSIDLQKGDTIYLFTDGYADQFGGPKGKKFKYAQLKETILSIHKSPLKEQQQILHKVIESWKGKLDQVDDILVVGIRI